MQTSSNLVRLQSVNLNGSIQMFGMTTTRLVDGYNGLRIDMRADTGVVTASIGGKTYALSPASWSAAEIYAEPMPVIVAEPALPAEPQFERLDSGQERIPVATIRKRQSKKMAERIGE